MLPSTPATRRIRIVVGAVGAVVLLLLLSALLLLNFGWGLLRPLAARRLSAALERPVRIGAIQRVGGGLLHPLLAIRDVSIPQPGWAGPGDMLRLREGRVALPALPLLVGHIEPELARIDGLRLALIRDKDGRATWERPGPKQHGGGGGAPDLSRVVMTDAIVSIDDRKHQHRFTLSLGSDAHGFRAAGPGSISGQPATLLLVGPPVSRIGAWPFRAEIHSTPVTVIATGRMRAPLDIGHFTARLETHGHDLTDLDHVIEAGLPPSQPFRLSTSVIHDKPRWVIRGLSGTIGRSALRGDMTVDKQGGGRTFLKGSIVSSGFDFDDLSSDAQLAKGRAEEARTGPRLFPTTRIDLSKLRRTDGVLHVDIRRILSTKPTVFRTLKGTMTLDHGVLTAAPLHADMVAGTLAGSLVVRHASGTPLLLVDLRLANSRFERLFKTNGILFGPLAGRAKLAGHGETVREAIGRSDGRIALAGEGGVMTKRVAAFLGADVGHGLFAGNTDQTGVRCIVANFAVAHGMARPHPLVIDTDIARADGAGSIRLADERMDLRLFGTPKRNSALRLNGPIVVSGTIEQPKPNPPPQTKSVGGLLKMVGKALGGDKGPIARDADCRALVAQALR